MKKLGIKISVLDLWNEKEIAKCPNWEFGRYFFKNLTLKTNKYG
jgi:hypothetical protein